MTLQEVHPEMGGRPEGGRNSEQGITARQYSMW